MIEPQELEVAQRRDVPAERVAHVQSLAVRLVEEADIFDQDGEVPADSSEATFAENARRMATALQTLSESYPELLSSVPEDVGRDVEQITLTDEEQELVIKYRPLVAYVARRVLAGLPRHFDEEDLVSYGILGLIDAIARFDESRFVRFETYAIPRIKGAIIDELRAIDWVPRSVRTMARNIENTTDLLASRLGRFPTDAELAEELEVTTKRVGVMRAKTSRMGQNSLDALLPPDSGGDRTTLGDTQRDKTAIDPLEHVERHELNDFLRSALASLTDVERYVVESHEFDCLTLTEIGNSMGVTESRACQIHTKALRKIRSLVSHEYEGVR